MDMVFRQILKCINLLAWLRVDSPRHRFARRPSLRLRRKEGVGSFILSSVFNYPYSSTSPQPSLRRSRREGGPAQRRPGESNRIPVLEMQTPNSKFPYLE